MELTGAWRAAVADDDLRRDAIDPSFDDDGWEPIPVPGHWRGVPAFAEHDGPLLYRTRFAHDPPPAPQRQWLVLEGVFYQADVYLDGAYLGDPEGYFFPHAFDISALSRIGDEHVLTVEVACPRPRDKKAKRNLTGVFQHWDCIDPDGNPGGLWRPVRLEQTGPVRINRLRVLCSDADANRATIRMRAELDSDAARRVLVRSTLDGSVEKELEQPLAEGTNTVEWSFGVDQPRLWWPRALGDQPLSDVEVTVLVDGEPSHHRVVRTGVRQVAMRGWVLSVNGERLFLKGANLAPTRAALGDATPEEIRRDVSLAAEAGLDLLRVHGHIGRPELYDAADEAGLLVWQDMPLQWGYARSIGREAARQAVEAVDLLGHHPSLALWCAHNEPFALDVEPGLAPPSTAVVARLAAGQQLPTWNRTVLDRKVKRALERADGTRPVIAHSGVLPHPPQLDGTDSHLYFGWYHGGARDLPGLSAAVPRLVRFVSEFGAQAVPESAEFLEPERWPDLDWEHLARHHALQTWVFDQRVPPSSFATFDEWRAATQRYQALVLKLQIEHLRRLKYAPTGGFCFFLLNDAQPAVTWSVLDHRRVAKRGFHAVIEACRPVIVVADPPPERLRPGQALALDVHVVSDLHHRLDDARVTAAVRWDGGEHRWRWGGDVPADASVRIGTVQLVVPDSPGSLALDLEVVADSVAATNRYRSTIVSSG